MDVVQIAFETKVYVLHLDVAWKHLPPSLDQLLKDESITKVGKQVGGDISRINKKYDLNCKGKLELGSFCSAREIVPNGQASLSELSMRTLGYMIPKDEQVSDWSSTFLTEDQIKYAAIDAWTSLEIYKKAKNMPEIGKRLSKINCEPGLFVALKPASTKKAAAYGQLVGIDKKGDGEWARVRIIRVMTPGYMTQGRSAATSSPNNNTTTLVEHQVALDTFGMPPFEIDVLKKDLIVQANDTVLTPSHKRTIRNNESVLDDTNNNLAIEENSLQTEASQNEVDKVFKEFFGDDNAHVDKEGFTHGYKLFNGLKDPKNEVDKDNHQRVYSRVIKDIFHLMDMVKPYKRHGLYKEFTVRFSDALFTIDNDNKTKVEQALIKHGETWNHKWKYERG